MLTSLGVASIELNYRESRRTDEYGNQFRYRSKVRDQQAARLGDGLGMCFSILCDWLLTIGVRDLSSALRLLPIPSFNMTEFKPCLAITVHGIRTHARWQRVLGEILNDNNIRHRSYDLGHYGVHKFLFNSSREKKVDEFYDFYSRVVQEKRTLLDPEDYSKRPSIVAHSFGSYIVGYCMLKYEEVKFDKIILCGSILPVDFDWFTLFSRDQVNFVRNDYGIRDFWTRIVGRIVLGTGKSGCDGFGFVSTIFSEERFDYFHHSDYFHRNHMRKQKIFPGIRKLVEAYRSCV
jgi:pimeloyl-ACP methyl ester carboxylesterase